MAKLFVNMNDLPVIYTRHRKSSKMLILVFVHIAMGHKQSFELAVPVFDGQGKYLFKKYIPCARFS